MGQKTSRNAVLSTTRQTRQVLSKGTDRGDSQGKQRDRQLVDATVRSLTQLVDCLAEALDGWESCADEVGQARIAAMRARWGISSGDSDGKG